MDKEDWLDDNNRYLAASLHWLRLRLRGLVADNAGILTPLAPAAADSSAAGNAPTAAARKSAWARRAWFSANRASAEGGSGAVALAPAGSTIMMPASTAAVPEPAATLEQELTAAEQARHAAAQIEPPPALLLLGLRLGLSQFETDITLLCVACELDPNLAHLIAAAEGPGSPGHPTFALALRLFDAPAWDALSPHRPLRRAHLLDISQPGATPLTVAPLRVDERVLHFVKGLNELDPALSALLRRAGDDTLALSNSQREAVGALLRHLQAAGLDRPRPMLLVGSDPRSQLDGARAACQAFGLALYRLPVDALPAACDELEQLAQLWQRECALLPLALYLDATEFDDANAEAGLRLRAWLDRELGPVFIAVRDGAALRLPQAWTVEIAKPTSREQFDAWLTALRPALADAAEPGASRLAGQFNLNLHEINHALALAQDGAPAALADRAWDACRQLTQPQLDALAQRIDAHALWDDLVLDAPALQLLRQIAAQARQRFRVYQDWGYAQKMTRGLGISALFSGESGTGKTMAAEVIANELDLALYRVDLSAVVSKYIGETEKNLRRLFDAAESGGAILFFDEADALFGKRSEVKDSHDRYANIEINYLLQRMESFSGLAILATNMKSALDSAFLRRLRFVVDFPYPGAAARRALWRQAVLPTVPSEDLDYDRLARFNLSGGNVASAALNAAFSAAEQDAPLTTSRLLASLRSELRKLDKPVNETELR